MLRGRPDRSAGGLGCVPRSRFHLVAYEAQKALRDVHDYQLALTGRKLWQPPPGMGASSSTGELGSWIASSPTFDHELKRLMLRSFRRIDGGVRVPLAIKVRLRKAHAACTPAWTPHMPGQFPGGHECYRPRSLIAVSVSVAKSQASDGAVRSNHCVPIGLESRHLCSSPATRSLEASRLDCPPDEANHSKTSSERQGGMLVS